MINQISLANHYLTTAPSSLDSRETTPQTVDALLFMLPGIERSEIENFCQWATQAGLVHYV